MKEEPNSDKYQELERERQKRAIESRREEEWIEILKEESYYLKGYLEEAIARSLERIISYENLAQRLTYNGKRVAGDAVLVDFQEKVKKVTVLQTEYAKLKSFQEVLPWIKKNFGEDADFQTLLQFLNPIELTPQK